MFFSTNHLHAASLLVIFHGSAWLFRLMSYLGGSSWFQFTSIQWGKTCRSDEISLKSAINHRVVFITSKSITTSLMNRKLLSSLEAARTHRDFHKSRSGFGGAELDIFLEFLLQDSLSYLFSSNIKHTVFPARSNSPGRTVTINPGLTPTVRGHRFVSARMTRVVAHCDSLEQHKFNSMLFI